MNAENGRPFDSEESDDECGEVYAEEKRLDSEERKRDFKSEICGGIEYRCCCEMVGGGKWRWT